MIKETIFSIYVHYAAIAVMVILLSYWLSIFIGFIILTHKHIGIRRAFLLWKLDVLVGRKLKLWMRSSVIATGLACILTYLVVFNLIYIVSPSVLESPVNFILLCIAISGFYSSLFHSGSGQGGVYGAAIILTTHEWLSLSSLNEFLIGAPSYAAILLASQFSGLLSAMITHGIMIFSTEDSLFDLTLKSDVELHIDSLTKFEDGLRHLIPGSISTVKETGLVDLGITYEEGILESTAFKIDSKIVKVISPLKKELEYLKGGPKTYPRMPSRVPVELLKKGDVVELGDCVSYEPYIINSVGKASSPGIDLTIKALDISHSQPRTATFGNNETVNAYIKTPQEIMDDLMTTSARDTIAYKITNYEENDPNHRRIRIILDVATRTTTKAYVTLDSHKIAKRAQEKVYEIAKESNLFDEKSLRPRNGDAPVKIFYRKFVTGIKEYKRTIPVIEKEAADEVFASYSIILPHLLIQSTWDKIRNSIVTKIAAAGVSILVALLGIPYEQVIIDFLM